jgi:hypothetical protein
MPSRLSPKLNPSASIDQSVHESATNFPEVIPRSSDPTNEIVSGRKAKRRWRGEGGRGWRGVCSPCAPLVNRNFQRDVPVASNEKHDEIG